MTKSWQVSNVRLEAHYWNAAPERAVFNCRRVALRDAVLSGAVGADQFEQASVIEPAAVIVSGVDVVAIDRLGWRPTAVAISDRLGNEHICEVSAMHLDPAGGGTMRLSSARIRWDEMP